MSKGSSSKQICCKDEQSIVEEAEKVTESAAGLESKSPTTFSSSPGWTSDLPLRTELQDATLLLLLPRTPPTRRSTTWSRDCSVPAHLPSSPLTSTRRRPDHLPPLLKSSFRHKRGHPRPVRGRRMGRMGRMGRGGRTGRGGRKGQEGL
eukprot:759425-Hanusia_phi.AAC.1